MRILVAAVAALSILPCAKKAPPEPQLRLDARGYECESNGVADPDRHAIFFEIPEDAAPRSVTIDGKRLVLPASRP